MVLVPIAIFVVGKQKIIRNWLICNIQVWSQCQYIWNKTILHNLYLQTCPRETTIGVALSLWELSSVLMAGSDIGIFNLRLKCDKNHEWSLWWRLKTWEGVYEGLSLGCCRWCWLRPIKFSSLICVTVYSQSHSTQTIKWKRISLWFLTKCSSDFSKHCFPFYRD